MSTAINELKKILAEGPTAPRMKQEKLNFIADYYATKFREFLSPDSEAYKAVINPVFSFDFEIGSKEFISELKVFSLRDGVMPLMRFFAINANPYEHVPLLIVDSSLSSLVPPEWREKVILRETFVEVKSEASNKILLLLSADPHSLPLDILDLELEKLAAVIKPADEIHLLFSSMRLRGEGEAINDHAWGYKCLQKILLRFRQNVLHVVSYPDYLKTDYKNFRFFFINPLKFYFTDSFLFHDLCSKGAMPLFHQKVGDQKPQLKLSFHHGLSFDQNFQPFIGEKYLRTQKDLYSQIVTYSHSGRFSDIHNKLYPADFIQWGSDVATSLYRPVSKG